METADAIYFYGLNDDYSYMSNFYKSSFSDRTNTFNCSEQYFMYHKCLTFEPTNNILLNEILNCTSASKVKELGRKIKNYDEHIWDTLRYNIMYNGLLLKFAQNDSIKQKLINTHPKTLYEASKYDKIWGIGYYANDAIYTNKNKYGRNLLGHALMNIRNYFMN